MSVTFWPIDQAPQDQETVDWWIYSVSVTPDTLETLDLLEDLLISHPEILHPGWVLDQSGTVGDDLDRDGERTSLETSGWVCWPGYAMLFGYDSGEPLDLLYYVWHPNNKITPDVDFWRKSAYDPKKVTSRGVPLWLELARKLGLAANPTKVSK